MQGVPVRGAEHETGAASFWKLDPVDHGIKRNPSRRHADRCHPAHILVEGAVPSEASLHQQRQLVGVLEQRPDGTGDGVSRFILAAADDQLHIRANLFVRHPGTLKNGNDRHAFERLWIGCKLPEIGKPVVYGGIENGDGMQAAGFDFGIAAIIGDAVDHGL